MERGECIRHNIRMDCLLILARSTFLLFKKKLLSTVCIKSTPDICAAFFMPLCNLLIMDSSVS